MEVIFKIVSTQAFDRKYAKLKRKNRNIEDKFVRFVKLLSQDSKYPSLKSHQIDHLEHGKIWSSWVHDDLRVLWQYEGDQIVILLLDIGDHDHIY